ncbi:hypothetical protein TSUD_328500 [Trifolium subterraneum]|uniref:Aminotransferase-like plant mobile domain-containing protein n=1 Tax=Trifolium subterraneum TaxID=3900 RepID=A0A2Z6MFM4_TRISU|nr:hypothetical protein TSUD_328500 [Trifolium subterraneum]
MANCVLRQFGYVKTIPRYPHRFAPLATSPQEINYQFARFMDQVLTPRMLESHALNLWLMTPNYMTWYMKISHSYLEPLPAGDLPRPAELDVIIDEEAEGVTP